MDIDPAGLEHRRSHDLLTGAIIPRPIAWVSTVDEDGQINLAPFSMFNLITWDPPTLCFSAVNRPDGTPKDTVRNIRAGGQFVVNLVSEELAPIMVATSAALPHGVDEAEREGIKLSPSLTVSVPRVRQAKVSFECVLDRIVVVGEGANVGNLILGTIRNVHLDDGILDQAGNIDWSKLHAVARLGGNHFCRVDSVFELSF